MIFFVMWEQKTLKKIISRQIPGIGITKDGKLIIDSKKLEKIMETTTLLEAAKKNFEQQSKFIKIVPTGTILHPFFNMPEDIIFCIFQQVLVQILNTQLIFYKDPSGLYDSQYYRSVFCERFRVINNISLVSKKFYKFVISSSFWEDFLKNITSTMGINMPYTIVKPQTQHYYTLLRLMFIKWVNLPSNVFKEGFRYMKIHEIYESERYYVVNDKLVWTTFQKLKKSNKGW